MSPLSETLKLPSLVLSSAADQPLLPDESPSSSSLFPPGFAPNEFMPSGSRADALPSSELEDGEVDIHNRLKFDLPVSAKGVSREVGNKKEEGIVPEFRPGSPSGFLFRASSNLFRKDAMLEGVFSLLIDNLPFNANPGWPANSFCRFGSLVDVYILGHYRRESKNLYGFVRFRNREDVCLASASMNGVRVGNLQLVVKEARFGKPGFNVKRRVPSGNANRGFNQHPFRVTPFVGGPLGKEGITAPLCLQSKPRLYAQAVIGEPASCRDEDVGKAAKKLKVSAVNPSVNWLDLCAVAKVRNVNKLFDAVKLLENGPKGLKLAKIWGGRRLILEFWSLDDRSEALEGNGWVELLEDLYDWNGEVVFNERLVWLSCERLPISIWNWGTFSAIAGLWGSFVSVDVCTSNSSELSKSRILIETEASVIGGAIDVCVSGVLFEVFVKMEEGNLEDVAWTDSGLHSTDGGYISPTANLEVSKADSSGNLCQVVGSAGVSSGNLCQVSAESEESSLEDVGHLLEQEVKAHEVGARKSSVVGRVGGAGKGADVGTGSKGGVVKVWRSPERMKIGPKWSLNLRNKSSRQARKIVRQRQCSVSESSLPSITPGIEFTRKMGEMAGLSFAGVDDDCI